MHYVYLALAIASEVVGTTMLKISDGFTNRPAVVGTLAAYTVSFWFLSLTLRTLPIGVAYAVWSAVGIVLITIVGWLAFDQVLSPAALIGIGLIVVGVVVLQIEVGDSTL